MECGYLCPCCCQEVNSDEIISRSATHLKELKREAMVGLCVDCLDYDGKFMQQLADTSAKIAHTKEWALKLKNSPRIQELEPVLANYIRLAYEGTEKERIAELGRIVGRFQGCLTRPNLAILKKAMRELRYFGLKEDQDAQVLNFLLQRLSTVPKIN